MSFFAQLEGRLKRALLDRDTETTDVLKLIKSSVLLQAKESGLELPSDEMCQAAVYRQIKAYEETAGLYRQRGEQSSAEQQERELRILQSLLPAQLGQSDLESVVEEIIGQSGLELEMGNFKALLEAIVERVGLAASRGQIAQVLRERITAER